LSEKKSTPTIWYNRSTLAKILSLASRKNLLTSVGNASCSERQKGRQIQMFRKQIADKQTELDKLYAELHTAQQQHVVDKKVVPAPINLEAFKLETAEGSLHNWHGFRRRKSIWLKVNEEKYPHTSLLLEVSFIIGPSNAKAERFFSRVTWLSSGRRAATRSYPGTLVDR
jgi:hypothetical protein